MAIDTVAEEVAQNLEVAAQATRSINAVAVGTFLGGTGFGGILGFFLGYRFSKEKIREEVFKESEEEIEKIRQSYMQKAQAVENMHKPSVEDLIEEKGYSVKLEPPSNKDRTRVTGIPESQVRTTLDPRPLNPPVPIHPGLPTSPMAPAEVVPHMPSRTWNYALELSRRSTDAPYVIHQQEFVESETEYEKVTYTYYEGDGVFAGEDNEPLPPNAGTIIGLNNLKWGYGTDDEDVVFIRNDMHRLEIELCRHPGTYNGGVAGFDHDESV